MIHKALLFASAASTAALATFGSDDAARPDPAPPLAAGEAVRAELYWADYDGDGLQDAFAVQPGGIARLLRQTDTGFEDVTGAAGIALDETSAGAAWQDVDGDGALDLLVVARRGSLRLFRGRAGAFEEWTAGSGLAELRGVERASWIDADGDGRADLHLVEATGHRLLRNAGDGCFEPFELPLSATQGAGSGALAIAPGVANARGAAVARPEVGRSGEGARARGAGPLVDAPRGGSVAGGSSGATTTGPGGVEYIGGGFQNIYCPESMNDQASPGSCVMTSSTPTLGMLYPLGSEFFIDSATGNVGIGTTSPSTRLHVAGEFAQLRIQDDDDPSSYVLLRDASPTFATFGKYSAAGPCVFDIDARVLDGSGNSVLRFFRNTFTTGTKAVQFLRGRDPMTVEADAQVGVDGTNSYFQLNGGNVGVGSAAPVARLDVRPDGGDVARFDTGSGASPVVIARHTPDTSNGPQELRVGMTDSVAQFHIENDENVSSFEFRVQNNDTEAGGGANANDNVVLTLIGDASGGRARVPVMEITGGADIVEGFESAGRELAPGTVVVIDPETPGALMASSTAYDTKVAGVVSGAGGVNPGIRLGQEGVLEGDVLVAMTGRVWVKCSAENGAIEAGDMLTSASLEGHAMRATDKARLDGTVLGKAMSRLDEGVGLVLVLVNLQ